MPLGFAAPIPTFPANCAILTVASALASISGIPEISFTLNIIPELRLLLILNNCPAEPS